MLKNLLVGLVIGSIITPAFSAQDVYLTFKDGRTAVYKNLPDSMNNDQFAVMLKRDYGKDFYTDLDLSKSRVVEVANNPEAEVKTGFWDSTAGTITKVVLFGVGLYALSNLVSPAAPSGVCDYTWQTARDGSRCGNRAAIVRPGGKF